jgi:hypothetical protein
MSASTAPSRNPSTVTKPPRPTDPKLKAERGGGRKTPTTLPSSQIAARRTEQSGIPGLKLDDLGKKSSLKFSPATVQNNGTTTPQRDDPGSDNAPNRGTGR